MSDNTDSYFFYRAMLKHLTFLLLIAILGGSALAGVPLHSGERACRMGEMEMDCCQTAQMQSDAPEVLAARLCCALECPPSVPAETGIATMRVPAPAVVILFPLISQPLLTVRSPLPDIVSAQTHASTSPPTYIRHLALLI